MAINLTDLIDLDLLSHFKSKLDLIFAGKVDKVDGKGLSSNDYTSEEKAKLANIAAGAQVNVLEGIQKNGVTITPTNKIANISVPTKTSDLTNDSNLVSDANYVHTDNNYTTAEKSKLAAFGVASTYYNKTEIDQLLTGAMTYKGTKATTSALPSSGNSQGDVWHVTADGSEWAWNGSAWEELGTAIDLSGYVEESEIGLATENDIDGLFTTT